ncbi:protein ALWAYS EARLY 3-like [Sesamum indicum]|uniref:Protein ALWAYS EARLY 3-like n=1 Tax=Sesamum indicum TaxID=4182 RepID=A0A8M8V900_SESIN|nr:protein ALWAYS EARLY 3-like [Sesamum indicum]XP_020552959.1 protein ALWAYS EARLY 3-like [Sesamum indicum]XP_020552960.1 protein ALWAYS EARLY 3-like [Sesamum indicum]
MGPTRKSRSVNKRYSQVNEVSPSKDGDGSKRSNSRKRKLSDMLGPRWTMEELTRFYDSYRKNGKDWKKVANAVKNRSSEMAEALYTMNRAYLSLPHGTASAAGLIAMMTDHYCNLAGTDSDQESNDGVESSQKTQKRARGKVQPPTSKPSADPFVPHSPTITSNYGCLSLLKKKRSGGTRPRPVGKRTPRFPVSYSYENINGEKYFSPTRQGLKLKASTDDDEVAHEVAIALAEASQRGGSPQVSGTPSKRAESVMSSPFRHAERKNSVAEMVNAKPLAADTDEEDLEGSTEADTGELSGYKPCMTESASFLTTRQKGTKVEGKKIEVDNNNQSHLDNINEECSGTEEGQRLGATSGKFDVEVNNTKNSRSFMQSQKKKSKKVLFGRDEGPAFDALQTLADLSLMMPTENEDESRVQFKDEHDDHVGESVPLEALPANQPREKRRSSGVRMKGHLVSSSEVAPSKTSKPGKSSIFDVSSVPEENHDSHQPITKTTRKKPKMQVSKIQKSEAHPDIHLGESLGSEVGDAGKKLTSKIKKSARSSSPKLMKISENSSSADLRKEGSDSAQSDIQVPVVNQVNLPTKVRSRRKMNLKKPQIQKDLKFPDKISDDQSNLPFGSLHNTAFNLKEKLSNCLLNQRLRRWCTYEWFYSAIDYPWFAKSEFVEYLYHVGLGHVPRLTRVEWGVIRSSLGKPRRFSGQFLKEEKEKLNQYRDSVRKHYTELREGVREGLPTDLARPLSVGQRVIAIHPKTREIHDGSVLTVDHSKCRVQFDRHELGVEFVMDIDCMPLNPLENMPALLGRHTVAVDKSFENFNELQIHGRAKEHIKLSPGDNLDSIDGISQLPPLANPAILLDQTKVASANTNVQTRIGPADAATYQQMAYSQPSTLAHVQAKEADVQALAELTRALDKKEAIVLELRRMNDDVLENQKDGNSFLKESEPFKKQYAAVLIQLNDANEQVSSALHCLRERNTYQGKCPLTWPGPVSNHADAGGTLNSSDRSAYQTQESGSNVNEIMDSSRTKARKMVDVAMQAISSLKSREDTIEKIEEAIDYVNDRLPSDDSCMPVASDPKLMNSSDIYTQIPSELIGKCVATLLMIQKCTERQFPPSDIAEILDSAVTSLQPHSSQNLPVYTEIQKCVGIIKNQILALIPT